MDADDRWSPWIEHNGVGCPCLGKRVQVICHGEISTVPPGTILLAKNMVETIPRNPHSKSWNWTPGFARAIRYRVHTPDALLDLKRMVENLRPVPQTETEDA